MRSLKLLFVVFFVSLGTQGVHAQYGNAGALVFSVAPKGGINYGAYGKIKAGEPVVLLGLEWMSNQGSYGWIDFGGQIDPISKGVAEPAREGALRELKEEAPGVRISLGNFHNVKSVVRKNGKVFTPGFNRDVYRPSYQMFFTFSKYISAEKIEKNAEKLRLKGKHGHVEKLAWMWVPLNDMMHAFGVVTAPKRTNIFSGHKLHFVRPHKKAFYKTSRAKKIKTNTSYFFRDVFYRGFLNISHTKKMAQPFYKMLQRVRAQFKRKRVCWDSDPVTTAGKTLTVTVSLTNSAKQQAGKCVKGLRKASSFVNHYHVTIGGIPGVAKKDEKTLRQYLNAQFKKPSFDTSRMKFKSSHPSRYTVNRLWKDAPVVMKPSNPGDFVCLNKKLRDLLSKFRSPSGKRYTLSSDTYGDNYVPHYTLINRVAIQSSGTGRNSIIKKVKSNMSSLRGRASNYSLMRPKV